MNSKKTVLVISDGHEQFDMTATLLRGEGYCVRFGSDTNESLMMAGTEPLDLIISELAVPNVDGLQLCRRIRDDQKLGSTPILLVGDLSKQSSIVEDSFRCGAADYVQKPIDPVQLVDKCRDILAQPDGAFLDDLDDQAFDSSIGIVSDYITIVNADSGTILFESPSTENVLGYAPNELVGTRVFDLIHPSDRSEVVEYLSWIHWDAATSSPIEHRVRHKDGSWKLIESKARPVNDARFGAAVIITSHEKTEPEFTLSDVVENNILRGAIFDRNPMGIALFSPAGHLIESNPALLEMLDYNDSELRNMSLSEFIFPFDDETDRRALVEVFSGKRSHYQFENGYLTTAGERVWGSLTLVTIPEGRKERRYLMAIFEEPTDQSVIHSSDTGGLLSDPRNTSRILDFQRWKVNKGLVCQN